MGKRKTADAQNDGSGSGSDSDISIVDISFDFHPLNPSVDYQSIKHLFTQLFQRDAHLLHLHDLTELVLAQSEAGVGTTVKTADEEESDPYAVLSVVNMGLHRENLSIKALVAYLLQKSSSDADLHATLQTLFSVHGQLGLILCERLINMPLEIIPHMYRMLRDEIESAASNNPEFAFTHLIILSRTYHLSLEDESYLAASKSSSQSSSVSTSKKKKKRKNKNNLETEVAKGVQGVRPADGVYSFHPEDECIMQASTHVLNYEFTSPSPHQSHGPRDGESFGLDTRGRLMFLPMEHFKGMVRRMGEVYA